jgi:PAS domain S-box-containing protein
VTDRKRAELALRASEARLAEAQKIARIGSWEWEFATHALWWSDEMYRLFGYAPGAVTPTAETFFAVVHPDDRPLLEAKTKAAAARGEPYVFDFRVLHPGGGERVLHAEGVVVRDAAGRAVSLRGATQDITDRVRAEAERRQFDEQLRQTQKLESLGVLAGGIAHDFNNLLTGILGNASLAREILPGGSETHEFLRPIEHAAAHAASLCQQMLAYAGKGSTVRGALHLNRLIADTADLLRLSASKKSELRFLPGPDLPVLEGDASQIRQVLLNLVSNASEAIGDGAGVIEISTGWSRVPCPRSGEGHMCGELAPGQYAWIQVRDTGCGMPPEVVRRIFEPFFTTKFTGRGLGLSAVHGIARSHGGAVCVTSTPGAGTTFRVYLGVPAEEPTVRTPQIVHTPIRIGHAARRPAPPTNHSSGVAVVADDDPAVRQLVAVALQSLGFEVRAAENGAEAVELVRAGGPAVRVVVLDILMPVMDVREALAEVRAARPDLPVIVMSGYSEPDLARQFADRGVVGFVQKPFRPVDLTACVRRALSRNGHPAGAR